MIDDNNLMMVHKLPRIIALVTVWALFLISPFAIAAQNLDPRRVSVLYVGDPYPGVSPYQAFREDAFIAVSPIRCYHHGGAATELVDVHKYMRIYMPRNEQDYLKRYDVVLLSDAYRRAFTLKQLKWFQDSVVDEGFGLAMVGGLDSFGASTSRPAASWSGSRIEEILPVEVPPPAYHHNWISPYVRPGGAAINIENYENEFISSLPFETMPMFTRAINGQIVLEKPGTTVIARWVLPEFNNPPCYSTWKPGNGRTFAMMHDWNGGVTEEYTRWAFYGDFAINLMLYVGQKDVPQDYTIVHQYRDSIHRIRLSKNTVLAMIGFIEKFGGNPKRVDEEMDILESMVAKAGDHYLNQDFNTAIAAAESANDKMEEIQELAIRIKNEALLWVYIVEWLSVTGVSLISGFIVWSLMIRRKLYRSVRGTRLSRLD